MPEPFRELHDAVRKCVRAVDPERRPKKVVVLDDSGEILSVSVPACPAGWVVTERSASYEGRAVPVSAGRLRLLRILVEAEGPMPAADLMDAFAARTSEDNIRYHVRKLNEEIARALPDLGFAPVEGTGEGYQLILR